MDFNSLRGCAQARAPHAHRQKLAQIATASAPGPAAAANAYGQPGSRASPRAARALPVHLNRHHVPQGKATARPTSTVQAAGQAYVRAGANKPGSRQRHRAAEAWRAPLRRSASQVRTTALSTQTARARGPGVAATADELGSGRSNRAAEVQPVHLSRRVQRERTLARRRMRIVTGVGCHARQHANLRSIDSGLRQSHHLEKARRARLHKRAPRAREAVLQT